MVIARDPPAIATFALMGGLVLLFTGVGRESLPPAVAEDHDVFDILPADELSLDQMDVRPGGVLVLVRNPHSLAHLSAALQTPRDRDVVVMTVRLQGVDVSADDLSDAAPTAAERRVLSEVSALAERNDRPVRLLVIPAHDVFAAIVATILRLRSSDVHVGESSTLSADEQARLLGEAWEKGRAGRTARRPARRPSPQRPDRHVPPRGASAVALSRRSRSHPSRLARRDQGHRPACPSSRRRQGSAHRKWNSN